MYALDIFVLLGMLSCMILFADTYKLVLSFLKTRGHDKAASNLLKTGPEYLSGAALPDELVSLVSTARQAYVLLYAVHSPRSLLIIMHRMDSVRFKNLRQLLLLR